MRIFPVDLSKHNSALMEVKPVQEQHASLVGSHFLPPVTHGIRVIGMVSRQDPLEAILVIFGRRVLIVFCLKALGKI